MHEASRGRGQHDAAANPAQHTFGADQCDYRDTPRNERRVSGQAADNIDSTIDAAEPVFDLTGGLRKLAPLHSAVRTQFAVAGRKLIESLAHRRARS